MRSIWIKFSWQLDSVRRRSRHARRDRAALWRTEALEVRSLPSATYSPAQITHAYGVDQIQFGTVRGDGSGQTIAIVDAYDAPQIGQDLSAFDATYGLPNTDGQGVNALAKATPQGVPAYNSGWAQEITLDVEWAHAIAPGAHILLVEAASNSFSNLLAAVDYARSQPGVAAVSMSWGSGEFSGEASYDSHFTTPSGHAGVAFVASSGDTGAVTEYPAVSPNVMAVGGTTLNTVDVSGTYGSESGWSGSGGGISKYESKPDYQSGVTQSSTKRTSPDVAYDADPNTGVSVYFQGGWYTFGGTSAGAPQWAALVAIADQGRALNGQTSLDGRTQLLPAIYSLSTNDFHDMTTGSTKNRRTTYTAGPGYDLVTGRGTPLANLLVADLARVTFTATATSSTTTTTTGSPPSSSSMTPFDGEGGDGGGEGGFSASDSAAFVQAGSGQALLTSPGPGVDAESYWDVTSGDHDDQSEVSLQKPTDSSVTLDAGTNDGSRAGEDSQDIIVAFTLGGPEEQWLIGSLH